MADRLFYTQISDNPINWLEFFREIRASDPDWTQYHIMPGEEMNLSAIAYRIYGNTDLAYVIREVLKLEDAMKKVTAGTAFRVPTTAWLRERILYWKKEADKLT